MLVALNVITALWSSSVGRIAIIGALAFMFGFSRGYSFEHKRIDDLKVKHAAELVSAINSRDAYWSKTLDTANKTHESELEAAIASANSVSAVTSKPELVRLCRDRKAGADCREK